MVSFVLKWYLTVTTKYTYFLIRAGRKANQSFKEAIILEMLSCVKYVYIIYVYVYIPTYI